MLKSVVRDCIHLSDNKDDSTPERYAARSRPRSNLNPVSWEFIFTCLTRRQASLNIRAGNPVYLIDATSSTAHFKIETLLSFMGSPS